MLKSVALLLVLAMPALADVLVLKDGTVIDCKIRDIKTPNSNQPSVFTVLAEVDEEGTIKQFPSSELRKEGSAFAIYRGKSTWERRAEYRKEYERRRSSLKETWEAHTTLGRWCRGHLLGEAAEEHFKSAYALRAARTPETADDRLKLSRWCGVLGLEKESEKELRAALAIRRADPAASPLDLGKWAEGIDLPDEAIREYEAAGPDGAAALKRLRESPEYAARKFAAELARDGRAWIITVALQDAAGRELLEGWKKKIEELSAFVFNITEGQFYIAEAEIEDKLLEGTIVVDKGKLDWKGLDAKDGRGILGYCRSGLNSYEVHVPGLVPVSALAHEMFHGAFGLPDEYTREASCECLMKSSPAPPKLCDASTHAAGAASGDCWGRIQARYRSAKHPNPAWKPDQKPPPTRVAIVDN